MPARVAGVQGQAGRHRLGDVFTVVGAHFVQIDSDPATLGGEIGPGQIEVEADAVVRTAIEQSSVFARD